MYDSIHSERNYSFVAENRSTAHDITRTLLLCIYILLLCSFLLPIYLFGTQQQHFVEEFAGTALCCCIIVYLIGGSDYNALRIKLFAFFFSFSFFLAVWYFWLCFLSLFHLYSKRFVQPVNATFSLSYSKRKFRLFFFYSGLLRFCFRSLGNIQLKHF